MLISLGLLLIITAGGLAVTYFLTDEEPLMWRAAAGCVLGSAVFGTLAFVLASLFGFGPSTILLSLLLTVAPAAIFVRDSNRRNIKHDWAKAKGKLQGATSSKALRFCYYLFFALLFWFFFSQAMYEMRDGIYTGGSQNLGDLPFHLGAIFGFTEGNNFPPQNPNFAGARFSYPFIADLITACFVKMGAGVSNAIFLLDFAWAMSLLVVLERFAKRLTGDSRAAKIVPALLFFSGGLGFLWFFRDFWESGKGIFDFLGHIPTDYTIGDKFRWGNSLVVLFITQRSLLLGMPLTVIILGFLWRVFISPKTDKSQNDEIAKAPILDRRGLTVAVVFGIFAGTLPLIHLHSLVALFVVTAFLFFIRLDKWQEWVAFGVGVAIVAVPELIWSLSGSASETSKFIGWHFGWDKGESNVIWFWLKNTGLLLPVLIAGTYLLMTKPQMADAASKVHSTDAWQSKAAKDNPYFEHRSTALLYFYLPFAFLFILSNVVKLAPWEWDNIKVLIYWFLGSLPLVALFISRAWDGKIALKIAAGLAFTILILAGALDAWRTASSQVKTRVYENDAIQIAEQIKQKTPANALFLNAPTYNSPVVLSGRQSLMRYSGHLSSHGIDYLPREDDVKRIYQGSGVSDILLRKYNIGYVLISPEERNALQANESFFKKYPVIAESGQFRVYEIKN